MSGTKKPRLKTERGHRWRLGVYDTCGELAKRWQGCQEEGKAIREDGLMPESEFITKINALFHGKNPPFLFIGSGFSRRHLGLDDFKGLLKSTCLKSMKPFEYYYSTASEDLPKASLTIASDFQNNVWSDDDLSDFIEKNKELFKSSTDAYKFYVSDIIKQKQETAKKEGYKLNDEIEILKK